MKPLNTSQTAVANARKGWAAAGRPVRVESEPPVRFVKGSGFGLSPQEKDQARTIANKRLDRIEKTINERVQGLGNFAIQGARENAVAFLSVLDSIRNPGRIDPITKAFDITPSVIAGPQAYDLEKPAKLLYPALCPIRNMLPRVGGIGEATNWGAILSVDTGNIGIGVQTGTRAAALTQYFARFSAPYRSIGLENYATFEAQTASQGYEDVLALITFQTLQVLMIREEQVLISGVGNPSEIGGTNFAFGAPTLATMTTSTTGGSLAATTAYFGVVVAMTMDGSTRVLPLTTALPTLITRTNIDGTTSSFNAGFSKQSNQLTVTTGAGSTNSLTLTCNAVPNAYGYVWCIGTASGGPYTQVAVTCANTVTIGSIPANAALPAGFATTDFSFNNLFFDGIWTQSLGLLAAYVNPSSVGAGSSYFTGSGQMINQPATAFAQLYNSLNGAALTSSAAGGANEINAQLQQTYDLYKFSPQYMFVHASTLITLSNMLVSNNGAPLIRYVADLGDSSAREGFVANQVLGNYMNPVTMELIKVLPHPYLIPGKILTFTQRLPWPLPTNTGNLAQIKARRDYYAEEWPPRTRRYEYGVYSEQLAQCYFPPGFTMLDNIGTPTFIPSVTMPLQTGAA